MKEKTLNKLKERKGISLIVLILTIIVVIILATAVIQSFSNNNPIEKAKEAKFKNDVKTMQEELEMAKLNSYFGESEDITIDSLTSASNYNQKFVINDGTLEYVKNKLSSDEIKWAKELKLSASSYTLGSSENDDITIEDGVLRTNWNGKIPEHIGSNIIIPKNVTRIDHSAFYGCDSLESVVIPETVTEIGLGAFKDCTSLESVVIPDSVTYMDWQIFMGCTSLKNVILSNKLKTLNCAWFANCTSLESIIIPSNITYYYFDCGGSFYNCTALKHITINGEARFRKSDIKNWFRESDNGEENISVDIDSIKIDGSGYIKE